MRGQLAESDRSTEQDLPSPYSPKTHQSRRNSYSALYGRSKITEPFGPDNG